MPFLNMCKLSSQKEMKSLLPTMYQNLKEGNFDCLVEKPNSDLGKYILSKMYKAAAEGSRIQHGREYGFYGQEYTKRATDVSKMADMELELIPSHNLDCKRNLSIAGVYMKRRSKCSNRFFKARCIRGNVISHQSSQVKKIEQEIQSILDQREHECKSWNGPFLTIDEMKSGLANEDEDGQRKIFCHKITFQKATHLSDALVRKELYLINKQSVGTIIDV